MLSFNIVLEKTSSGLIKDWNQSCFVWRRSILRCSSSRAVEKGKEGIGGVPRSHHNALADSIGFSFLIFSSRSVYMTVCGCVCVDGQLGLRPPRKNWLLLARRDSIVRQRRRPHNPWTKASQLWLKLSALPKPNHTFPCLLFISTFFKLAKRF